MMRATAAGLCPAVVWMLFAVAVPAQAGSSDFTALVRETRSAVVNISTTQKAGRSGLEFPQGGEAPDLPEGQLGDLLRKFFGDGGAPEAETHSLGSGFIISPDGYILTNYHVVEGAEEVLVRLIDRRELAARIIGSDRRSDIALLKIAADHLPVAKMGRSSELKVGEWVLAIGSPFGFDYSVTAGIVSATGRSLPRENYIPFIQTDVAINPGNSGGPLFNMRGQVVGVNAQIYSASGGYMGLSFAVPIDVAMNVAEQLKASGHVTRGWLGVLVQTVNRELAESFGLAKPMGALVAKVLPGGPGAKAGLKVGDIIVAYDGAAVVKSANLPPLVGRTKVGSTVPVKVIRDGKTRVLEVTIGELPDEAQVAAPTATDAAPAASSLGLSVKELTPDQRQALDDKTHGVLVSKVDAGPAKSAGIRPGDVIVMLNNVRIRDTRQFARVMKGLPRGKTVPVLVQRSDGPVFLALRVPG